MGKEGCGDEQIGRLSCDEIVAIFLFQTTVSVNNSCRARDLERAELDVGISDGK